MSDPSALRRRAKTLTQEVRDWIPGMRARLVRALVRHREMRFPPAVHRAITASDDFRYATLGLALRRVLDKEIRGAIPEVGVWRCETSDFPHHAAPQHRLDRFDTFEGFREQDLPPGDLVDKPENITECGDIWGLASIRRTG